jgi:hypothetical protein
VKKGSNKVKICEKHEKHPQQLNKQHKLNECRCSESEIKKGKVLHHFSSKVISFSCSSISRNFKRESPPSVLPFCRTFFQFAELLKVSRVWKIELNIVKM